MKTSLTIKPKVGDKDIRLEKTEDGNWLVSCWCSVWARRVQFPMKQEHVENIISNSGQNIQEILPDTPPALREIFLTGMTAAEFELLAFEEGYDVELGSDEST